MSLETKPNPASRTVTESHDVRVMRLELPLAGVLTVEYKPQNRVVSQESIARYVEDVDIVSPEELVEAVYDAVAEEVYSADEGDNPPLVVSMRYTETPPLDDYASSCSTGQYR